MGDQAKEKLIKSDEFEKALVEGAEFKREIMTTYKEQNKANYKQFQEIMYEASPEIKAILEKKKKNRIEDDNQKLQDFKKLVAQTYHQTLDLTTPEDLDEGKPTKAEKIAMRIMPVLLMLRYIGSDVLDSQFKKLGLKVDPEFTLESIVPGLSSEDKKSCISSIFESAKSTRLNINRDSRQINEDIFQSKVPVELQYDKKTNNAGLKPGDFRKLVDMKTKLIMAQTEEAKEKAEEKIEQAASEKQFEAARAELVRDKLTTLS